ncbi:MAG: hypothetical protein IPK58_00935 [Acidobacteria bacterium]|nr:hypothetical protein [Acidobacteriota bacterium]
MAKFEAAETQVFGISMDSFAANKRFAEDIKVNFPLAERLETQRDQGLRAV